MIKHIFNKYSEIIFVVLLALCVFYITFNFYYPSDTYFDIRAGQVSLQKGIIFHDVFSFTEYGKFWIPSEWLSQIVFYFLDHYFGMNSIGIFTSLFSVLQILIVYYYLKKFFKISPFLTAIISLIYTVGVSTFLVPRPNLFANLCFVVTTFVILLYVIKNKNYLWLLVPFGILWINFHGSFIVLLAVLVSYTLVCLGQFFLSNEKLWLHKAKILGLYALGILLLTFAPPLYGTTYQLLLLFYHYGPLISQSTEWERLYQLPLLFWTYSCAVMLLVVFGYFIRKKVSRQDLLIWMPFGLMVLTPYLAYRNLLFGWFGIMIVMGYTLEKLRNHKYAKTLTGIYFASIIVILAFYTTYLPLYNKVDVKDNPQKAAAFILKHHLKGNMFNTVDYGMYLLYALYPQQKVFVDGRLDIFFCCELADLHKLDLVYATRRSDYPNAFFSLLDKYHISFVTLTRDTTDVILLNFMAKNPQWSLVYWDDNSQIFVRRHDKNDTIIRQFGTIAAQPYNSVLYDHQNVQQAIDEYNRMISISDSAKSRNILGIIYLRQGDVQTAAADLQRAVQVDPTYPPPYVNLAYIAYKEGDYNQAMSDYQLAIKEGSTDPVPYITLGELYIRVNNDTAKAKDVWQQGLQKVADPNARAQLTQLINSY